MKGIEKEGRQGRGGKAGKERRARTFSSAGLLPRFPREPWLGKVIVRSRSEEFSPGLLSNRESAT